MEESSDTELQEPEASRASPPNGEFAKISRFPRKFTFTLKVNSSFLLFHFQIALEVCHNQEEFVSVAVDSIKEVRVGRTTELLRAMENYATEMQEECAFSIIHGDQYECLDLIAKTPEDAKIWITGLVSLTSSSRAEQFRWLESVFDEADPDKLGCILENQAVQLIKQLNSRILLSRVKHKVKEACILNPEESQRGKVTRSQFVDIYRDVATRPEIYFLMVQYANKDYLSCKDLQVFLETEQGLLGVTMELCEAIIDQYEPSLEAKHLNYMTVDGNLSILDHLNFLLGVTMELCEAIIDQYEPSLEAKHLNYMTVDGFTNYLLSEEGYLFDIMHKRVCQEMNQPFSNYFIATSYNTYLVEDQLKGPASSDGYITALRKNCRYPLFIRLELHLDIEWQLVLVNLLCEVFGNKLYRPRSDPVDWVNGQRRPTPKDFQMRIILVGRRIDGADEDIGEFVNGF
ncbi:unnamed protein product [Gongylonema pulchrum]|uniref:PLCXc domain-containing protein n=1 Tax=Gongylonema pulchrum TaxID=637853 RepID=A0A183DXT4_9BILA|nr:unnamed protein product [Gongylonema pulchrum]